MIHNGFMIRNLDIALLRTFVAVADHASMTAAGNALHLTQSAVSQQIARLEDLSGALFVRERRTLRLTPSGERLLGKARRLIALNDELWAEMSDEPIKGSVRLGAPYDLVGTWLTTILKAFAAMYPKVEIELVCLASPELLSGIASGSIDLALIEEPVGISNAECLAIDRLVWVGAKGGAAHLKTPLPVSMVAETCAFRPVVLQALEERNLTWRTMFESGSIDATRATVRADLAVTAWLASTVPNDLNILPFEENLPELPSFAINLYQAKGQLPRAVSEIAQQIRVGMSGNPGASPMRI
ncbi:MULTISPECIES: LysR substrate-binding domain-containing protein [unclassified Ochrobactrum]|uniref:LysR substrate-binding domain-containing protein n=1 Tax=unclassified Ochrobactrum TaxID=239106 RepID=UPI00256FC053|nr:MULTISPECIES: LysR substrate-binding domain-containing protein [unclassified Ochrobactrum]